MFNIEEMIDFENKHKLAQKEFLGLKIYQLIREYIINDLSSMDKNADFVCDVFTPSKKDFKIYKNFKNRYIFVKKDKSDILFITDHRRILQGDKYESIYTDEFENLVKDKYKTITIEQPSWACFSKSKDAHTLNEMSENIKYLDLIEIKTLNKIKNFKFFHKLKYKKIVLEIKQILNIIFEKFNIDLSCHLQFYIDNFLYCLLSKKDYEKIIDKIDPRCAVIYYRAFPAKVILVYILRERKIKTIEVQHGTFFKDYPVNQMANKNENSLIKPDFLFSFGEKQVYLKNLRYKKENVLFTGNLFLNKKLKTNYSFPIEMSNKKKNILFISQTVIGNYLSKLASEVNEKIDKNSFQILYRFHPQEINKNYECLNKCNIKQLKNVNEEIYKFQKFTDVQIGVFSTAIFEGLAFAIPTIIIINENNIADVEYTLKSFKQGVYFAQSSDDIIKILNTSLQKPLKEDIDKLWAKNPEIKFKRELDKIIKQ